jgi:hypothetical protein
LKASTEYRSGCTIKFNIVHSYWNHAKLVLAAYKNYFPKRSLISLGDTLRFNCMNHVYSRSLDTSPPTFPSVQNTTRKNKKRTKKGKKKKRKKKKERKEPSSSPVLLTRRGRCAAMPPQTRKKTPHHLHTVVVTLCSGIELVSEDTLR